MDLLILGASARSAAFSALRLGIRPTCADLFGDLDLYSACLATRIDSPNYPDGLAVFAETRPPGRWLYTGAIENYPDLVDRISKRHGLLGNSGAILRAVRDPFAVKQTLHRAGLNAPESQARSTGLPTDGSWLVKPRSSAGGRGIRPWKGVEPGNHRLVYYQQRIAGLSLAAIFVGNGVNARCLGITRQYVGRADNRFAYRGSLGPWPVSVEVRDQIDRSGQTLAGKFGLLGLFGIDLIVEENRAWPIEINPRYTASVEVLEWALGRSLLGEHLVGAGSEASNRPFPGKPQAFVGKAIVHASQPLRWPELTNPFHCELDRFPECADIPQPGTLFRACDPVLTVLARGDSPEDCRRRLGSRIREWRDQLRSLFL